jgi:indole-3-glycerol phosphate synthase
MHLLEQICNNKRLEIACQQEAIPLSELKNSLKSQFRKKVSFKQKLLDSETGIIAEFKRKSPSKGWINPEASVTQIVKSYESAGAAAISCLTDEQFFGGSFADFKKAREAIVQIPLLRKDFILNEYQLFQSKIIGADIVLLIAACLTREEIARFTAIAHELDMEVLIEIHDVVELSSICPDADVVGINNRNLNTFVTDIRNSLNLVKLIPENFLKISESGLSSPETVVQLRQAGFRGFLMGETFMKASDPGEALREFIQKLSNVK